jgi:uncharacterized protein YbaA (DUF1428 family)
MSKAGKGNGVARMAMGVGWSYGGAGSRRRCAMSYLFVWVLPMKKERLDAYRESAAKYAPIWKDHGAISVIESVADNAARGEVTSFPRAVQLEDDEVCVLTIIRFPDKATHDTAIDAAMADPRAAEIDMTMLDGRRLIFAGFAPFVDT